MREQIDLLATVTVLGVLEQAYFALQVIYARRKHKISPPQTTGHPEFERIFRAQLHVNVDEQGVLFGCFSKIEILGVLGCRANCSEYFPIFISLLWVAGIFFHQGVAAVCGLLYLFTRFRYFHRYAVAAQGRLGPLYASARLLWLLLGLAVAGLLAHFLLPNSPWAAVLPWPLQLLGAR